MAERLQPLPKTTLPPSLFMEVVTQSPTAITITDTDAHILYANPAFERLTGYSLRELLGQRPSMLSYRVTPKRLYEELWSTILGGESWDGVLVNRRKDGSRFLSELTISPVFEGGEAPAFFISMQRDVTELHDLTTRIENQKGLLESVVDAAPLMVVLVDQKGKVLLDNRAYKTLRTDMGGSEPADHFLAAFSTVMAAGFEQACARDHGFSDTEIKIEQAGGLEPRWFSCSGSWVRESALGAESYFEKQGACALLITANEITKQKRQQEALRLNALRALMTEQGMTQRLRETLSGALYQMQVPINMLEAAASLLQHQLGSEASIHATLQQVIDAGREAVTLLQSAVPQESEAQAVAVDLNGVIHDVLMVSTGRLLAEGLTVDWKPSSEAHYVDDREGALRTLVKHLLDNAIDAVNEPGCPTRELLLSVTPRAPDLVELAIQDSGPGIAASLQRRVFDPFFSNWQSGGHRSGMGLTVAQQCVLSLQGELMVDGDHLGGCRICALLPQSGSTNKTVTEEPSGE